MRSHKGIGQAGFSLGQLFWSSTCSHINKFPVALNLLPQMRKFSVLACGSSGLVCSNVSAIRSFITCRQIQTDSNNEEKQVRRKSRRILDIDDVWLTPNQWKETKASWISEKEKVIKMYISRSPFEFELDAMNTIAVKNLSNAGKSLMAYLQEESVSLNYQVISKGLHMCLSCKDLDGIFWCVEWLNKSEYIMDKGTIANVISGLCLTDRWQESLTFVTRAEDISSVTPRILEPLFIAACRNDRRDLAKDLLEYHYRKDIMPSEATCLQLLSSFCCNAKDDQIHMEENGELVRSLLAYMREKRHYPPQSVADKLGTWFER